MKNILLAVSLYVIPFLVQAQCSVSLLTTSTINCHGVCTGALLANNTSGTAPFTYSWSSLSSTDDSVSGLCAGTYTVTSTDFFGCTATDTYIFSPPQVISINATVLNSSCSGNCNGDISMTVSGGTTPYTYSWFYGDVTEDLHGICPGTYCETISDSIGCSLDTCFVISEPSAIFIGKNVGNVSCPGGADGFISLDVSGGTLPYKYFWYSTSDSTNMSDSLMAGNYCFQVTDSTGCGTSDCVDVSEPLPYSVTATLTEPKCYGGADGCLQLTVSGGTAPYTYAWNSGATTMNLCPVPATFYSVHITDTMGCTTDTSFNVGQPMLLDVTLTGTNTSCTGCNDASIDATPSGGTAPYTYSWSPNVSSGNSASGLAPGTYTVCVTDTNGCSSCDSVEVFDNPTSVRNGGANSFSIYPNPARGRFTVYGLQFTVGASLELYDVLGENVLRTQLQTTNNKLQTEINVSSFPKGIYFVKIISGNGELMAMKKIVIN